jgi:hypothetical protein
LELCDRHITLPDNVEAPLYVDRLYSFFCEIPDSPNQQLRLQSFDVSGADGGVLSLFVDTSKEEPFAVSSSGISDVK